jgi:aryl-alcohol dehydrogenase-like predicted oxidoreductase/predicted kinase
VLPARIGLGTLRLDGAGMSDAIAAALDAGILVFDTARAYGDGDGGHERILGGVLARHPRGGDAFVITKGGMRREGNRWRADGRASTLRADCEASRAALGRPIDLYLVHAPDPRTPFSTTLRALARLRDEGLVRAAGVSNVTLAQLDEALALLPIAAVENALSLDDDAAVRGGVLARCRERGVVFIAHSPLGGPRRAARLLRTPAIVARAASHAIAPAAFALAALTDAFDVAAVAGARDAGQARQIAAASSFTVDAADRDALAAAFPSLRAPDKAPPREGEVVLIMGLPGAGKSDAAARWSAAGYARLNRDELGGSLRQLARRLDDELRAGRRRVVLDNTYTTRAARAEVLAVAARHGVAVRGVWLDVSTADAQVNLVQRMLDAHGRLLSPEELARGRDNTTLAPLALFRLLRSLEPPAADEGFAALETIAFARRSRAGRPASFVAHELADTLPPAALANAYVFGWAPADASLPANDFAARAAGVALCPHGGGPPICWCRPPLPGLLVALAHVHGLDLSASAVIGRGRAHAAIAAAVGARFEER